VSLSGPIAIVVVLCVGWLLPWLAARAGVSRGRTLANYRGAPVPLGLGWAWLVWGLGIAAAQLATFPLRHDPGLLPLLAGGSLMPVFLIPGVAALGLLDDVAGRGDVRGFRGHLAALAHGRVTTGLVKAFGIGVLALASAWRLSAPAGALRPVVWVLAAAVIALTANLVNLLDLRPGRALKAYLALALVPAAVLAWKVASAVGWPAGLALVVLVLGPALACWRSDLAERGMLGDMGANAAGALAGWLLARAMFPSVVALALAAAVLLALNLASERVSFSAVIEGHRVLKWLDELGRLRRAADETGS
jgi:hypothetical protein